MIAYPVTQGLKRHDTSISTTKIILINSLWTLKIGRKETNKNNKSFSVTYYPILNTCKDTNYCQRDTICFPGKRIQYNKPRKPE